MKYVPASRNTPTLWDGLVVLLVLLMAAAITLRFRPDTNGPLTATLSLAGVPIETFVLEDLDEPIHYKVPNAPYEISLTLESSRIRVEHSDCPNQDCVHSGWVSRAGGQLVCLPNRMLVTLSGGALSDDGADFILQ